jgi:alpha-beta hydrolase superfamily lysophospholipase
LTIFLARAKNSGAMKAQIGLRLLLIMIVPGQSFGGAPAAPQTFDSKGVAIQYTVEGSGEPVVLIHGLYANANLNWRAPGIIRMLATNHQVIAMDVRGHAGSGKPETADAYGVEMAEDIIRLLDHLKIEKAHIIGDSYSRNSPNRRE